MKKILLTIIVAAAVLSVNGQTYRGDEARAVNDRLTEKYSSGLFKSADGTVFDLEDDTHPSISYLNILDWLNGQVAGLQVYTNRYNVRIPYIRGTRAQIYVDEIRVEPDFLNALPTFDIGMIKVIRGPFAGGFGNNSVIAIYRFKPDPGEEEEDGE
jgi:hypothetical protein